MKNTILIFSLSMLAWTMGGCGILLPDKGKEGQPCLGQNICETGLICKNDKCVKEETDPCNGDADCRIGRTGWFCDLASSPRVCRACDKDEKCGEACATCISAGSGGKKCLDDTSTLTDHHCGCIDNTNCAVGNCNQTTKTCESTCVPNCTGKNCGDSDGCSGKCINCPSGEFCDESVTPWACSPCVVDQRCGTNCSPCGLDQYCGPQKECAAAKQTIVLNDFGMTNAVSFSAFSDAPILGCRLFLAHGSRVKYPQVYCFENSGQSLVKSLDNTLAPNAGLMGISYVSFSKVDPQLLATGGWFGPDGSPGARVDVWNLNPSSGAPISDLMATSFGKDFLAGVTFSGPPNLQKAKLSVYKRDGLPPPAIEIVNPNDTSNLKLGGLAMSGDNQFVALSLFNDDKSCKGDNGCGLRVYSFNQSNNTVINSIVASPPPVNTNANYSFITALDINQSNGINRLAVTHQNSFDPSDGTQIATIEVHLYQQPPSSKWTLDAQNHRDTITKFSVRSAVFSTDGSWLFVSGVRGGGTAAVMMYDFNPTGGLQLLGQFDSPCAGVLAYTPKISLEGDKPWLACSGDQKVELWSVNWMMPKLHDP